jgi:type VI secretion system protein ImpC
LPDSEPFSLCLMGNFSGQPERVPPGERRPIPVDRDNFEDVLQRARVSVAGMTVSDLDDFHPDTLYRRLPIFRTFRSLRERLLDPETSAAAILEVRGESRPRPSAPDAESLLDLIIGATPAAAAAPAPARSEDDLQRFVREAVRPYLVARADPRVPEMVAEVDRAAAAAMREILHAPAFQSLEAAWRTAFTLVRRLDTGPELKLYLLDVTKEELAAEPVAFAQSLLRRTQEWSVLAACFPFGLEDLGCLGVLGEVARRLGAPVIGEADLSLLGDAPEWSEFRRTEQARWIGLALPRILLRLPYGKATSPCEQFDFEEVESGRPDSKHLLWGNPAAFCAMLIAEAGRPGPERRIGDLPIYVYQEEGESAALPCAEIELTEDTAEALLDNGMMPFVAVRASDEVRLMRFQSVANPPEALPGRWQ